MPLFLPALAILTIWLLLFGAGVFGFQNVAYSIHKVLFPALAIVKVTVFLEKRDSQVQVLDVAEIVLEAMGEGECL